MSALCMIRCQDAIVVASDGAACDGEGTLAAEVSKVALLPEYDCVLATRGAGNVTVTLHARLQILAGQGFGIAGFDDVLAVLPELSRHLSDELQTVADAPQHWTTLVGGYSVARDAFEVYRISTRACPDLEDASREHPPFMAVPRFGVSYCPSPGQEGIAAAGLALEREAWFDLPADELAIRAVCACRPEQHTSEINPMPYHSVGAFVQLTVLRRGEVSSRIVHRWPDTVGERLRPAPDDLLPDFLRASS